MPVKNDTSVPQCTHSHWSELGKKLLYIFGTFLVLYLTVYVAALTRNEFREYDSIGRAETIERTITLDAQGKATVVPDVAHTTIGMIAEGETVAEAQQKNTEVMNELIARLKELGIVEADIQTANYNVYPQYNYTSDDGRTLDGYEVSQSVTVKIRDKENTNAVLALAGEVGANSVGGVNFTIDDTAVYKEEARRDALRQVYEKATELSELLGIEIVGVVTYNEYESNPGPYPMYERAMLDSSTGYGGAEPQIESGTTDVYVTVSVTFEIR
jgi:uncharacterized protein YggE